LAGFPDDPVGYARGVLGLEPTPQQEHVMRLLVTPPYRVLVKSGHNIGKTHLAATLLNWWYDSFDPGVVITTAPTERDVVDLLWAEVRLQRQRARVPLHLDFTGPRAPELRTSEEHYAKGYTARQDVSFQGRHRARQFFVFDEADGIKPDFWRTTDTMCKPEEGSAWLAIGNPVSTSSQMYLEESALDLQRRPKWHVVSLSSLDHPNLLDEAEGRPPRIPTAVTSSQVDLWVADWCDPVDEAERLATDIRWWGQWYRPGPIAEARILGRRPSAGTFGVWSDALWQAALSARLEPGQHEAPEIGCDVARFGDDYTEIHCRRGPCSLSHEAHNGWDTTRTAGRLMELCRELSAAYNAARASTTRPLEPRQVAVKVDDDGVGGGVTDQLKAAGYRAVAVGAGTTALRPDLYPRKRDELWFGLAERARQGRLDLHRLPERTLHELRRQAVAVTWKHDGAGRRQVEPKSETKKRLLRSPDSMDAVNLAFLVSVRLLLGEPVPNPSEGGQLRSPMYGK
jgi:hypothetical protein